MRALRWAGPVVIMVAALVSLLAGPAAAATSQVRFKVTYGLAGGLGAIQHTLDLTSSPPGGNDFSCKPGSQHPNPVVLVHGAGANQALNWHVFAPMLANNGYCVFSLTYGLNGRVPVGGMAAMQTSASKDLAPFIDKVLAATGAAKVDLVGHSEGTVMPRYYLRYLGGAEKVDKYVAMTPLYQGSNVLGLANLYQLAEKLGLRPVVDPLIGAVSESGPQFLTGSDFLNSVNSGEAFPHQVHFTTIVTRYDEAVVPYTSGIAPAGPNITNLVLQDQCPTDLSEHVLEAVDPVVGQDILNALDPAHAVPVNCFGLPRNSG
ncbi:lipase family alpha/beta hydrolase [Kutzneria albida]|uniref:Lipase n=1 Tax=Kutzneria albida DSM 43870 TaxID=1449976 RepID=W5W744_9PSEU|nr:alpha/beta fold hydrolase [Kutzneria albida]AHH96356.1 lipase [Kutzneria albida DSM 43870]